MKKKFITGILLVAVSAIGVSCFTSCKDTEDDLRTELQGEQASLRTQLANAKTQLEDLKQKLDQINSCNCPTLNEDWFNNLYNATVAKTSVEGALKDVNDLLKNIMAGNNNANISEQQAKDLFALIGKLNDINNVINTVNGTEGTGGTPGLSSTVNNLNTIINGDGTSANPGLATTVNTITSDVEDLQKWFENSGWTPAIFQTFVNQGMWVFNHKTALEAIEAKKAEIAKLNGVSIDFLNNNLNKLQSIVDTYNKIFPATETVEEWWSYKTIIDNIKANQADIQALQSDVDNMLNRINDMVTGLVLQATHNPLFGGFNTPFGINSYVLMAYYGENTTGINRFPNDEQHLAYNVTTPGVNWDALMPASAFYTPDANKIVNLQDGMADLGTLWFTVNPGTVRNLDVNGFKLVNSIDEGKVTLANVQKDNETVFKFGFSRSAADNGLYAGTAKVAASDLDAIKVRIEPGLRQALVDAVKNRTATDMVQMAKTVARQLTNVCDANALRYTWTSKDKEGENWIDRTNTVYSNYGIAATAFKPLAFTTLYKESQEGGFKQIPTIGHIELDKSLVDLEIEDFKIGDITFDLNVNITDFKINMDGFTSTVTVKIPKKYILDKVNEVATLPANWQNDPSMYEEMTVDIVKNQQELVNKFVDSVNEWIKGNGTEEYPGLKNEISDAISNAVDKTFNGPDGFIAKIEDQVNDMTGNIQDKLDNLVDKINSDYLSKVNSLIDKVNKVSERINRILANPNHYLQPIMLYRTADGNVNLLSTNPDQPTQFKGNGEAIELWATTFNFETLCPVFKKCVVVTKVTKNGVDQPTLVTAANKPGNSFATVLDGARNRVALDVNGARGGSYIYEIAYQGLDYAGSTSTVKCYIQVTR